ncbi:hypothetical protein E2C01_003972 [Portunus trituberculatus]|uniref:Uncharacterized protein n=1 Tax=Portunus trituberculatus TaxID=210409 RepID=A0A5B7CPA3_PORTR|nr:hypothetical protein [Portunus trituberculatus]
MNMETCHGTEEVKENHRISPCNCSPHHSSALPTEQFPAAMHHESRAGPVVSPCSVFLLGAAFLAVR